jgi:hypothetical protein
MRLLVAALAALVALAAPAAPAWAQTGERNEAGTVGISIALPRGWSRAPEGAATRSLLALDRKSPEFQRALESNQLEPLIVIGKFPSPAGTSVPSIKIQYMAFPLRDFPLIDLAARSIDSVRDGYGVEVTVLEPPAMTTIGGLPAAHRSVSFSVTRDGVVYPTVSEFWVVRRGNYLFLIGANYDPAVAAATRAEIRAAIASIEIKPE